MSGDAVNTTPNQTTRRWAYGLNVGVGVVLATALLALVNWMGNKHSVPVEMAFTRHYKISDQTRGLLNSLQNEYTLVTLFSPMTRDQETQQAIELTDQYAKLSSKIQVEHITSGLTTGRESALFEKIKARYAKELEPIDKGVKEALEQVQGISRESRAALPLLNKALETAPESDAKMRAELGQYVQIFTRMGPQFDELVTKFQKQQSDPLPNSSLVLEALRGALTNTSVNLLNPMGARLESMVKAEQTPLLTKDAMGQALAVVRRMQATVDQSLLQLRTIKLSESYSRLVEQLSLPNTVLVLGPDKERVISLESMFRDVTPGGAADGEDADRSGKVERGFLGEEMVTGALVSLEQKQMPLVVFVYTGRVSPFGRPASALQMYMKYGYVAERLRKMDFEVMEWSPMGRTGPMGQPIAPTAAPEPKEGQRAVWVFLPSPDDDPTMMSALGPEMNKKVQNLFVERMSKGDSALVLMKMSPESKFNSDPMMQLIEGYGIKPRLSELVLRQVTGADRKTAANPTHEIVTWPQDLAVTKALSGMATMLVMACPITLEKPKNSEVELYPLIWVTGKEVWAVSDVSPGVQKLKYNPATASEKFVVAAAAKTKDNRLIVSTDPYWCADLATADGYDGPGTADLRGARFPGNQELFMNSVFWLAKMEQLIAASPRTQDIRRIQDISPARMRVIQWALILGLPLGTLALGVGVYLVRRRG
jgi:hypothetical protein